jgi:hypothetical protein
MSYRNPIDLVRERTEPKPEIHQEREERAAELETKKKDQFLDKAREQEREDKDE